MSALARQALSRRLAVRPAPAQAGDTLDHRVADWEAMRNAAGAIVNWQFTPEDARIKLRSLCPSFQS